MPDKEGICRDGAGKLYKINRAGARDSVDASGTRIFNYADGRKTSRPLEINSDLWEVMPRRQRKEYQDRQQGKEAGGDPSAPGGAEARSHPPAESMDARPGSSTDSLALVSVARDVSRAAGD